MKRKRFSVKKIVAIFEAGRAGHADCRHPSASRHFGTDVLPLEEAICRLAVRLSPRTEAAAG